MLISSYLAATRAYNRFFWVPCCFQSMTTIKPDDIMRLVVVEKMEIQTGTDND